MPTTDKFKPKAGVSVPQHKAINEVLKEHDEFKHGTYPFLKIAKLKKAGPILNAQRELQPQYVSALVERLLPLDKKLNAASSPAHAPERAPHSVLIELLRALLRRNLPLGEPELLALIGWLRSVKGVNDYWYPMVGVIQNLEFFHANHQFSSKLSQAVTALAAKIKKEIGQKHGHKHFSRLEKLLGTAPKIPLHAGEAWSDAAIADLKKLPKVQQSAWAPLLLHCAESPGAAPTEKWLAKACELMKAVGAAKFKQQVLAWFPLVDKPRTQVKRWVRGLEPDPNLLIISPHADLLRGLVWCCGLKEDKELGRALTMLARSAYRKIPMKGPREVKVGNACVTALGMMPGMVGVGQIALLKVRVKFGTAQKMIEKALETTAQRVGLPREELEEMAVPAYALTEVGKCSEPFGDYTAELTVTGSDSTSMTWLHSGGKRQQSLPTIVKSKFAADWKELQGAVKDIQRMLPAQRGRLDSLFREQKSWPLEKWRDRYLDHPLVGVLARRLIWEFTRGKRVTTGTFFNGKLVDVDLKPLNLADDTTIQLWHPIGKDPDEIVAWREWLDSQQIQQPFKQAHREVYLLTDAERRTRTYSNRFAAHIIRQHQFNALCAARGWKNRLRLMVDDEFPPATLQLPKWNLRAEFWIEAVGNEHGTDTNESGVFSHLSTDQVRFYRAGDLQRTAHAGGGGYQPGFGGKDSEPISLTEIPPLVFSEVMRDVDLFVGVASVGNDPTWNDGGPNGSFREYWQNYSFGDLNASAGTRKDVLQRLVPKLQISSQCSFTEKFLVVKGSLRTYKIHLGSGNILMAPNDQYLCIVPKQTGSPEGSVMLPFEGDRTLSVILSKAFMLADDTRIKDQSIVSQIKG